MNIPSFTAILRLTLSPIVFVLTLAGCVTKSNDFERVQLVEYAQIEESARGETSGIVKSRLYEGIYWIHGDSGDDPNVFPIKKNGEIASANHSQGVELEGLKNIDWEDIGVDVSGNLIVADIGNNCLCRVDKSILIFPEPDVNAKKVSNYQRFYIAYPESANSSESIEEQTPDAEAVFYKDEVIYILTKEPGGNDTKLYKLVSPDQSSINALIHVITLDFDDKVTAADLSVSGDSLVVLTSSSVWLFTNFEGEDYFSGNSSRVYFKANQVESVAFTGEGSVIIAEEEGQLYEIQISDFK
ncbi:MAG: hypothetical protein WD022_03400 [Balneolaceae bacterium]